MVALTPAAVARLAEGSPVRALTRRSGATLPRSGAARKDGFASVVEPNVSLRSADPNMC